MEEQCVHSDINTKQILEEVKTIALIGASSNPEKDSYRVMKFLLEKNYVVYPVNPNEKGKSILGQYCYGDLKSIGLPIDMVEVFRKSEEVLGIAKEAIDIGSKVLWTQLGIIDKEAFKIAKNEGLKVVMNRCPKIELKKIETHIGSKK
ncbi:CoA-binding protein [SAR86 cluster bacterium]|nr:CoA-binding protein [SAR86 cluster bacterium]